MDNPLIAAGSGLGGLGLFLLAVHMISEGLKGATGNNLRTILARWTRTPMRGILSGILITGLVQSSSAVTIATIGFVNAGILSLYQAMGVVFGANVGTTMTGWLVAAVGFKLKLEAFALPLIGIGMLLRLTGPGMRRGSLGEALTGFGLFFIGIQVLATAFESMATTLDLQRLPSEGILPMFLFVGAGFLMTLVTQSSSAAIAMILTAATGGILSLAAAAAMVVGANVGTTSTAALSVIGATSNAKRVAAAHILFNVLTGIVAIILLPGLLWLVHEAELVLGLESMPAVSLALFHTVFNVLGVLLMLPFARRLAAILERRFRSAEEIEGKPRYLDQNVAASPSLAINALAMELGRMAQIARRVCRAALSVEHGMGRRILDDLRILESLSVAIGQFVAQIERGKLSPELTQELPIALRATQYFVTAGELAEHTARHQLLLTELSDERAVQQLTAFHGQISAVLEATDMGHEAFSMAQCDEHMETLNLRYQDTKEDLLEAATLGRVEVAVLTDHLEQMNQQRRMARQIVKGVRQLTRLYPEPSPADTEELTEVRAQLDG